MKLKQKRNKFIQNGSEIKEVNKAENNVFISKNKVFQYKQLLNYMQDIFDMIDIVHCNSVTDLLI